LAESIFVEVEESDNAEYMPLLVYEAHEPARPIHKVRLFEADHPHGVYEVTGWHSEGDGSPCPALYAPVSDSGQAVVHLVYGGNWGVRLRPEGSSEEWGLEEPDQFGEPYLMLTDQNDVILD